MLKSPQGGQTPTSGLFSGLIFEEAFYTTMMRQPQPPALKSGKQAVSDFAQEMNCPFPRQKRGALPI
jgi:hypothetical protein